MVGVVHCYRSNSTTPKLGSTKGMEEPSFCNLSLAVDCTLSLGSTTTTTTTTSRTDAPARLSRVGSPDSDLALSLSVRSERAVEPSRRTSELEQDMSCGGSCTRSDPDASPECYPQVSELVARASDGGRKSFKAWPRSSYRDEVKTPKALFSMIEEQGYCNRSSRQAWLPNYLPSSTVNTEEQCMEDGDSGARACAHCGTSKTPLWRNGPGGPKSLCNACGIRFKKAGRRSAANGTAESPVSPPATTTTEALKRKLPSEESHDWVFPAGAKPRKRSRGNLLHRMSESSLSGSCMTWQPWSPPKSPLHRAPPLSPSDDGKVPALDTESFSSDEEEGAVLLMALSCGMVNA